MVQSFTGSAGAFSDRMRATRGVSRCGSYVNGEIFHVWSRRLNIIKVLIITIALSPSSCLPHSPLIQTLQPSVNLGYLPRISTPPDFISFSSSELPSSVS